MKVNKDKGTMRFTGSSSPFIALISCCLSVIVLLVWSHGIPSLGLAIVSPAVVEVCAGILHELCIFRIGFGTGIQKKELNLHTSRHRSPVDPCSL